MSIFQFNFTTKQKEFCLQKQIELPTTYYYYIFYNYRPMYFSSNTYASLPPFAGSLQKLQFGYMYKQWNLHVLQKHCVNAS